MIRFSHPCISIDHHHTVLRASVIQPVLNPVKDPEHSILGLRTFHSSPNRLWNKTEQSLRDTLSQKRFLRDLQRKITLKDSVTEHFKIN